MTRTASDILEEFLASNSVKRRSELADELIAISKQQRERNRSKVEALREQLAAWKLEALAARELIELTIAPPVDFVKTAQTDRKQGKKQFDWLKRELDTKIKNWKLARVDAAPAKDAGTGMGGKDEKET